MICFINNLFFCENMHLGANILSGIIARDNRGGNKDDI